MDVINVGTGVTDIIKVVTDEADWEIDVVKVGTDEADWEIDVVKVGTDEADEK